MGKVNQWMGDLIAWFEEWYDRIRIAFVRPVDVLSEWLGDCYYSALGTLGRIAGRSIVQVINGLVQDRTEKKGGLLLLFRKMIGILLIVTFWLLAQMYISAAGILGTLFGLRRGKEYPWSENFLIWFPLIVFALFIPKVLGPGFAIGQLTLLLSYSIVVLGLNISVGIAGILSLAQGAFVLIGGYISVLLYTGKFFGISFGVFPAAFVGGVGAALIGMAIGFPAVRVKGPYLLLMTLGLMLIVSPILRSSFLRDITGGPNGIAFDAPAAPKSLSFIPQPFWMYYHALLIFSFMFYSAHVIIRRSKVGRALVALHDAEERISVLGISVTKYKVMTFALSAFYGGVGGSVMMLSAGFIFSDSITQHDSEDFLVASLFGGRGTIFGAVVGSVYLVERTYIGSWLAKFIHNGEGLLWMLSGIILIVVVIFFPRGVVGGISHWLGSHRIALPSRRHHRRSPFPDYSYDEELLAIGSINWSKTNESANDAIDEISSSRQRETDGQGAEKRP